MAEKTFTPKEKEWLARLERDEFITMTTLEEHYRTAPPVTALDTIRHLYGHEGGGGWCKLVYAYTTLKYMLMGDTVCLLHAPLNCDAIARNYKHDLYDRRGAGFLHTPTTSMGRSQLIFGSEQELYEAILDVDRDYRPKCIVVMTGCAPRIIEDEIPRVIERARPKVKARILYISTAGFEGPFKGEQVEGHVKPYVELMDPPERVDKEKVNIVGNEKEIYWPHIAPDPTAERKYPSDADELGRLIEGLGLKVHRVLVGGGGYDYVRTAAEAGTNTVNCGTHGFPVAFEMHKRFGTPYVYHELPVGIKATTAWVMDLARLTGREEEGEKLVKGEVERIKGVWEATREAVVGKVAFGNMANNRGLAWLRFCQELGMEVFLMGGGVRIKSMKHDTEYYLHYGFNPLVLRLREGVPDQPHSHRYQNPLEVMKRLGLGEDGVVYFYTDFPPYDKGGKFDPANLPRVEQSVHSSRNPGFPHRGIGFRGTEAFCLNILDAVRTARRKASPTLLGRIYGQAFDFEPRR